MVQAEKAAAVTALTAAQAVAVAVTVVLAVQRLLQDKEITVELTTALVQAAAVEQVQ